MMLSFKEIRDLIDLVAERGLFGLEIEQTGFRIRIEGMRATGNAAAAPAPASLVPGASAPAALPSPEAGSPAAQPEEGLHVIRSPIVGTFYRAPSPEADPFADVGQKISRGKILCIIESMKLMNEIESDVDGEIVEVFARSGQPVEYGEKLFAIRLAA
jgi:acetyl-CoA carboxylase biotin carboxyl carrier protein